MRSCFEARTPEQAERSCWCSSGRCSKLYERVLPRHPNDACFCTSWRVFIWSKCNFNEFVSETDIPLGARCAYLRARKWLWRRHSLKIFTLHRILGTMHLLFNLRMKFAERIDQIGVCCHAWLPEQRSIIRIEHIWSWQSRCSKPQFSREQCMHIS